MFSALELSGQLSGWLRPAPATPIAGYNPITGGFGWPKKDPTLPHEGVVPMLIRRDVWLAPRVPELMEAPFASITALFQTAYGPRNLSSGPRLDPGPLRHEPLMAPRVPTPEPTPEPTPSLSPVESEDKPRSRWLTTPEVLAFFRPDEASDAV